MLFYFSCGQHLTSNNIKTSIVTTNHIYFNQQFKYLQNVSSERLAFYHFTACLLTVIIPANHKVFRSFPTLAGHLVNSNRPLGPLHSVHHPYIALQSQCM